MTTIQPLLDQLSSRIRKLSGVDVASLGVTSRDGHLPLASPGRSSPNGSCRLARAADGWIAVNLARDEDEDLVPAWLHGDPALDPWRAVEAYGPRRAADDLIADAALLGLPVARVGEVSAETTAVRFTPLAGATARKGAGRLRVLDLSALWAGPLCSAILADAGAEVTRVEGSNRPDPTHGTMPEFFRRLNQSKAELQLDLRLSNCKAQLWDRAASADILVTASRPQALAHLGLSPERLASANPGLLWIAITGYGWSDPLSRVAFGDDAAAAGGLVRWAGGAPAFMGDALADPLTGLAAALGAMEALATGRRGLIDAALAVTAAGAATTLGLRSAR